jgi:hypothetical protein
MELSNSDPERTESSPDDTLLPQNISVNDGRPDSGAIRSIDCAPDRGGKRRWRVPPQARQTRFYLQGIADDYRQVRYGPLQVSRFPPVLRDEHGLIEIPDAWKPPND